MVKCPICGSPLKSSNGLDDCDIYEYNCYRCGKYKIDEFVKENITNLTPQKIANISGWIREKQGSDIIIDSKKMESLMLLRSLSVFEKADKMLQYLAKKFPIAGSYLTYRFNEIFGILEKIKKKTFPEEGLENSKEIYKNITDLFPLISIGRIIDGYEFEYIWKKYMIEEKGYISTNRLSITMISPAGWAYLETFRHPNPDSKKAFIAMWLEPEMEKIYDGFIVKAIKDAGYEPIQIGRKEHNNDINDEIIGEIRSSKFIIADFTGNRGGVYYEAGFARGLNIEVIQTCREDHLKEVHFDVNHRKIIKWKDGKDLYKKLLNRIKATIM